MEYCAVDGEILVVVQNAKMQEVKSLARCLGDLAVRWWRGFACFACFAPALRAWFGGSVEVDRILVRRGLQGVGSALRGGGACINFAKFMQKSLTFALQFAPIGLGRVI